MDKFISAVLIVAGVLILLVSGIVRWIGLVLAVVGFVLLIFGNLLFGALGLVVGLLVFRFHGFFGLLVRLLGVALIAFGVLTLLG